MTEKYFYRDPLAAAWMAKHFGMQYTEKLKTFEKTDWQDPECYLAGLPRSGKTEWSRCNYYIHHDSYPVLEPKIDDVIELIGIKGVWPIFATVTGLQITLQGKELKCAGVNSWFAPFDEYKIIQRNGIAFIWPEKETAEEGGRKDG